MEDDSLFGGPLEESYMQLGKFYFIDRKGWNYDAVNPSLRSRGLIRTQFNTADFPKTSTLLPVQTGINNVNAQTGLDGWTNMLSPGDLITLVNKKYAPGKKHPFVRHTNTNIY